MGDFPLINTQNLTLSAFTAADVPLVQTFASEHALISMLDNAPYPYPEGAAAEWISTHPGLFAAGQALYLGIRLRQSGQLMGCVELHDIHQGHRAELGYWIALPFQRQGYAFEAACAMLRYGFGEMDLQRLDATVLTRNAPSIALLEKAGFVREGMRPLWGVSCGKPEDIFCYGLCRAILTG
ncbi:GNAT family N-acetyltransferase [Silvimonas iriomotensis]|uniref:N-acetyltransferase n=1 Tax=Silvimonas iriomotensis TaxID=449662 RepID=A0ABQ2PDX7_9NEIS|nr:GNAT family N-acetyltransferase [Silvimonas iriomotensis]GGP23591.1 N-acetyltransferase [Silvimonas iriomotensis]